jgi:hypothetical protein
VRARSVKPGLFKNEDLAELPFEARLLFVGLWCMADREGRLEDRPKRIKAEVFPYDDVNIEKLLEHLRNARSIVRYRVEGYDTGLIWIPTFKRHQNPHKNEKPSELPAYSDIAKLREHSGAKTEVLGLTPSSLTPSSLTPDSPPEGATAPDEETAQTIVAFAVDRARAAGVALGKTQTGHLAAEVGRQFEAGANPLLIRRAVATLIDENKSPDKLGYVMRDLLKGRTRERVGVLCGRSENGEW